MTNKRTIKFRVWHKKYKRWLTDNDYGTHASSNWMLDIFTGEIVDFVDADNSYSPTFYPNYYTQGLEVIKESPFAVQQYTGLKDKNDVGIYEGDILERIGNGSFCKLLVYWDEPNCGFFTKRSFNLHGEGSPISDHNINICDWTYWIVCGNIYETPELVKNYEYASH